MKKNAFFVFAMLAIIFSCSNKEDKSPPQQTIHSNAKQNEPVTLENSLALGETLKFAMKTASDGVRTAEIGVRGSENTRKMGIKIARERLKIVENLLNLFEKDAVKFRTNEDIKSYLKALPGYREQLKQYLANIDQLSR